jgi:hypothetical protein
MLQILKKIGVSGWLATLNLCDIDSIDTKSQKQTKKWKNVLKPNWIWKIKVVINEGFKDQALYTNPYESSRIERFYKDWKRKSGFAGQQGWTGDHDLSQIQGLELANLDLWAWMLGFWARILVFWSWILDLYKSLESFENYPDSWSQFKANLLKTIFVVTIWVESKDSWDKSTFLQISYTNIANLALIKKRLSKLNKFF